jgi:hypothetical protein
MALCNIKRAELPGFYGYGAVGDWMYEVGGINIDPAATAVASRPAIYKSIC